MPAPLSGQFLDQSMYGDPVLLGTIVATTTKNNSDTAVAFNATGEALKGKLLVLQPDADCYVRQVDTAAGTVTTANGIKLAADQLFYMGMRSTKGFIACVAVSGTANLRVFELNG